MRYVRGKFWKKRENVCIMHILTRKTLRHICAIFKQKVLAFCLCM